LPRSSRSPVLLLSSKLLRSSQQAIADADGIHHNKSLFQSL